MSSDETDASIIEAGELQNTEDRMRRALGLDGGVSGRPAGDKSAARHGDRTLQLSGGSLSSGHVPSGPTERRKHRFVQDGEIQYTVERRRSWTPGTGAGGAAPVSLAPRTNANGLNGNAFNGNGHAAGNHHAPATDANGVNHLQALEATLRTEQATRERMEKLLREAQIKIHDLQTNIGHATLARTEAQEILAAAHAQIAALETAAQETQAQLAAAWSARDTAIRARKELADELAEERAARQLAERAVQDAVAARLTVDAVREMAATPRKAKAPTAPRSGAPAAPRGNAKEPQPVKWWIKTTPKTKTTTKKI